MLIACSGSSSQDDECADESCGSTGAASSEAGSTGGEVGESSGSGQTGGGEAGGLPCDVAEVLAKHCGSCHGEDVAFGAPMPLASYDDLRVPAISDPTRPVYEVVAERIESPSSPMPPSGLMSAEDRSVIHDWIDADLPEGSEPECEGLPDDDPGGGADELPCEPSVTFLAHASNDADAPFAVPQVEDLYQCFTFDSPFTAGQHGTAWGPVIDDARVVHHWLLFRAPADFEAGSVADCEGLLGQGADLLMGWAPGAESFVYPDDVGLGLPGPDEKVVLQLHYNNAAGHTDVLDRSGVAVCTTDTPREHTAGTVWLGRAPFVIPAQAQDHEIAGRCDTDGRLAQPVNILASWPHMHEIGTRFETVLFPGGDESTPQTVVEVPQWNFDFQVYHRHEPAIEVQPGDVLRTACTYDNPYDFDVPFGEGTTDEMCFNFATVYPIDTFGTGTTRVCMQPEL